jgi:hypothetical protein
VAGPGLSIPRSLVSLIAFFIGAAVGGRIGVAMAVKIDAVGARKLGIKPFYSSLPFSLPGSISNLELL